MLNTTTLTGRLVQEPEVKEVEKKGKEPYKVLSATLAVNANEDTVYFIPVIFYRRLAEVVEEYCEKGDKITVSGFLHQQTWKTEDGENRNRIVIVVRNVEFMSIKQKEDKKQKEYKKDKRYR